MGESTLKNMPTIIFYGDPSPIQKTFFAEIYDKYPNLKIELRTHSFEMLPDISTLDIMRDKLISLEPLREPPKPITSWKRLTKTNQKYPIKRR